MKRSHYDDDYNEVEDGQQQEQQQQQQQQKPAHPPVEKQKKAAMMAFKRSREPSSSLTKFLQTEAELASKLRGIDGVHFALPQFTAPSPDETMDECLAQLLMCHPKIPPNSAVRSELCVVQPSTRWLRRGERERGEGRGERREAKRE